MEPIIDLAPGAESNPVAVEVEGLLRLSIGASHERVRDFNALRGAVLIVAQDIGEAVTLRFDLGRLTIHDGHVGVPTVTFCGDVEALRKLTAIPLNRLRLPTLSPLSRAGRATWGIVYDLSANTDLQVYGLFAHPRTIVRLLRLFSRA